MFMIDRIDPRAHALEGWREAEQLVATGWRSFLKAEAGGSPVRVWVLCRGAGRGGGGSDTIGVVCCSHGWVR